MDMVLALVFLLTVLAIFTGVQSRFLSSQSLITVQSQLHANARASSFLITQAGWYFPAAPAQVVFRPYAFFSSQQELTVPRSFGDVQSFSCTPSLERDPLSLSSDANVVFSLPAAETGFPRDVVVRYGVFIPPALPAVVPQGASPLPSRVALDACDIPLRVVP
jgi:hypothetical protein